MTDGPDRSAARTVTPLGAVVVPPEDSDALMKAVGRIFDFDDLDVMLEKLYGVRKITEWTSANLPQATIALQVFRGIETDPEQVGPLLALLYRDRRCVEPLNGMILRIAPAVADTVGDVGTQAAGIGEALRSVRGRLDPALREALNGSADAYAGFSAAAARLLAYKSLHDCLQREQKRVFAHLHEAAVTASANPQSRIILDDFVDSLDDLLLRIDDAMSGLVEEEKIGQCIWVEEIKDARQQIGQGLKNKDDGSVGVGLATVDAVVHERPRQLNQHIIQVMGTLPLGALRDALAAAAGVDTAAAAGLGRAPVQLDTLRLRLTERVKEHAIWQRSDRTLQSMDQVIAMGAGLRAERLANLWGNLKRTIRTLIAPEPDDPSTKEITAQSDLLDDAWTAYTLIGGTEEERATARGWLAQSFYLYRNAVINRFYQVDRRLMADCKAVARLGGPVDALLEDLRPGEPRHG